MWPKKNNPLSSLSFKLKKYHFIIVLAIIVILLLLEGFFLYKYFYTALAESKQLKELKQQAALEELKIPKFEQVQKFYQEKQQERPSEWDALRDPFTSL